MLTQDQVSYPTQVSAWPVCAADRGGGVRLNSMVCNLGRFFHLANVSFWSVRSGQYPHFGLFDLKNTHILVRLVWPIPMVADSGAPYQTYWKISIVQTKQTLTQSVVQTIGQTEQILGQTIVQTIGQMKQTRGQTIGRTHLNV